MHFWASSFDEEIRVADRIRDIAEFLQKNRDYFVEIMRDGGQANIYVFLGPVEGLGVVIEAEVLATLGDLGVELGIEIYLEPWQRAERPDDATDPKD